VLDAHAGRQRRRLWRDGSSLTSTSFFTPSCTTWCAICAGEIGPSTGWPPVIATASL
jgi:hypothetical protein